MFNVWFSLYFDIFTYIRVYLRSITWLKRCLFFRHLTHLVDLLHSESSDLRITAGETIALLCDLNHGIDEVRFVLHPPPFFKKRCVLNIYSQSVSTDMGMKYVPPVAHAVRFHAFLQTETWVT